jgi:hypothetical protein
MGHMGTLDELRRVDQARKDAELQIKQDAEARRQEQAIYKNAQEALKNATPAYKEHLNQATTYTTRMKANLAAAAGAKDQESYDKALSLIDSEYMTGQKLGYKLAYPEIPIPGFQRQAGQTLQDEITRKQAMYDASWTPQTALKKTIEEKQAKLKALGDYNYQAPGLQDWQQPELPTRPSLEDFLPGGSGYQGPALDQSQGPAPSAAAPQGGGGGDTPISEAEALKYNPNLKKGTRFSSGGTNYLVQ